MAVDLTQIIVDSYDSLLVTDKHGVIIFANPSSGQLLGIEPEQMIGKNVRSLLEKGMYDNSTALKAIETRSTVSGTVRTVNGNCLLCTSTPLIDDNTGEIAMVIVNALNSNVVEKYKEAVAQEKSLTDKYKNAVEYLSEVDSEQNKIVAESKQMRKIFESLGFIAKTDSTVLIFGESGTGKEVIARYIHRNSNRAKEPFIPVNCAAIPYELLESEFFGYAPGAFTGANSQGKPGLFEIADSGTLFLDEIGELPISMQSKLLRVLETGEIQRLGSTKIIRSNVRLISATNRDLKAMMEQNLFRSDLYYRLNVIPITVPPLRERPEDICVLAETFLNELNRKYAFNKKFTKRTINVCLKYSWPGNVRELRNVIERLVVTSTGNELDLDEDFLLSNKVRSEQTNTFVKKDLANRGTLKSVLKAVEEQYINQVLDECNGRVGEAARRLGIHRSMLYRKTKARNL
jgi:PAS domain S-box-containing protein